jgi:hypothetical protein
MTTTNLVEQYFCLLDQVGVDDFENPRLKAIRLRMTDRELFAVQQRLRAKAAVAFQEAEELEKFKQMRFGANDSTK